MLQINDNPRLRFGQSLRRIRLELHITQSDLAEFSNIYRGRISEYECGKRIPTQNTLNSLIVVLNGLGVESYRTKRLQSAWDTSLGASSGKVTGRVLR